MKCTQFRQQTVRSKPAVDVVPELVAPGMQPFVPLGAKIWAWSYVRPLWHPVETAKKGVQPPVFIPIPPQLRPRLQAQVQLRAESS